MEPNAQVFVRYGELSLKGGNRAFFERTLKNNLRAALADFGEVKVHGIRGRLLVSAQASGARIAEKCSRVFGVTSVSPAVPALLDVDAITEVARQCAAETIANQFMGKEQVRFRTKVNRAEKRFPLMSRDFEIHLADAIMPEHPQLKVDLSNPELTLEVDVRSEGAWVFSSRLPGPGGLPVGTMGRAFCLLSGGIDSPVAAWMAMKRGMRVEFVSFYSFPHVGPQSRAKIITLAEKLAGWQPTTVLHMVPFAEYQEAVRDECPPAYRTVLYRRAMQRISTRIAWRRKGKVLITGESVGQVASQTLENMTVIEEASGLPVLRPLVTFDKTETIQWARAIGTYELSNLPAPDCCTVFQPERPVIYGRIEEAHEAEAFLDVDALTLNALRNTELLRIEA